MAGSYARLPDMEEVAFDSPLSVTIPLQAAYTPLSPAAEPTSADDFKSGSVTIDIPEVKISSPSKAFASPSCDSDVLSDDEHGEFASHEPETVSYIKLVGAPASGNDQPLQIDAVTGVPIKPTPTSVGKELEAESTVIDVLEGRNEDPFTLEPFETLIQMHAEKDKDFIIARVTTVDPHDEARMYYSYYTAHHINKVLFRTQPEEGLLHRMKAKNPLNNMTIVGDVHYYVITAASALQSAAPAPMSPGNERRSFDSVRSVASINSIRSVNSIRSMISIFSTASVGSSASRRDFDRFRRRPRGKSSSVSVHEGDSARAGLGRFLRVGNHGVRKRTLHLIMRPEAVDKEVAEAVPLVDEDGGVNKGKSLRIASKLRPMSAGTGSGNRSSSSQSGSRRNSMDDAYSDIHNQAPRSKKPYESHGRSSLDSNPEKADSNRAFRSVVPPSHRRVRSTSFNQEHPTVINVPGWPEDESRISTKSLKYHPISPGLRRTLLMEDQLYSPASPVAPPTVYYTAKYYASDDDFLMKSAVRAYFKANALETQDAVLFTIPSGREESELLEGAEDHPALSSFVFAVSEEDDESGWGRDGGGRALKWLLFCYVAFGFLVVKFIGEYNARCNVCEELDF
ncbi:hypothetical protein BC832DRAFT_261159 [Gaertneriomyces semiglobifer]|nr:hypothetical protein BC832DRAFT_261159 [Gaertneriomyces semiglobifer]